MFFDNKKYGVFMGRFQPFHLGHQAVINRILHDGLRPLVFIGKGTDPSRYPLPCDMVSFSIKSIYPDLTIGVMHDDPNWSVWASSIIMKLNTLAPLEYHTIYYHCKPEDETDFECFGNKFTKCHYVHAFRDIIDLYHVPSFKSDEFECPSGTLIRSDPERYKTMLDARVYRIVKDKLLDCKG